MFHLLEVTGKAMEGEYAAVLIVSVLLSGVVAWRLVSACLSGATGPEVSVRNPGSEENSNKMESLVLNELDPIENDGKK